MGASSSSNTTQSSTTSTEIVKIVADPPKLAERYRFEGLNLLQWSSYVDMILRDQRLNHHLTNQPPCSKDPSYACWRKEEDTIQLWLLENLSPKISDRYLYMKTVETLWEKARQAHSKEHDQSQIYRLVQKSILLMQGDRSVTEYAGELECIWSEIDHYRPVLNLDSEERKYTEKSAVQISDRARF